MSGVFLCKVSLESMREGHDFNTNELEGVRVGYRSHHAKALGKNRTEAELFSKGCKQTGWKSAIWCATKTSLETTEYWTKETLNSPIQTPSLLFEENEARGTKRTSSLTHTANFKQNLGHSSCLLMTQIRVLLPSQAALQSPLQSADRRLKKEVGLYV